MTDLRVRIGKMTLKNPILAASGTFGYGREFEPYLNLHAIGGFCTKGISLEPRTGNPGIRIVETPAGILNAIGLENCGVEAFIREVMPAIAHFDTAIIVNFYAYAVDDFVKLAARLSENERVDALEMNISCPNVARGGALFGADPRLVEQLTTAVRKATDKTLIVKLSPNISDITVIARAAEAGGADAVSLINTLIGTAIDRERRRFVLGNKMGGLSGPAIKPIALRMVWQTVKAVKIPVIGIGGIATLGDVLDFLIVGARAVQVGSANFVNPGVTQDLVEKLEAWLAAHGETLEHLIGSIEE